MTQINEETILHLSILCRIEFTPEERKQLANDLEQVVGYFEQLAKVDSSRLAPFTGLINTENHMAEDIEEPSMSVEEFIKNAPSHVGNLIKVPTVIKF